jgi:uncharacterized protein (TIGR00290 family)
VSTEVARAGPWALATAAGKDATLALARAREGGLDVRWALSVVEGSSGLVRFHGTPRALVEDQARALGLEPLLDETHPRGFEEVFLGLLERARMAGAVGVLFGNLHLEEIRAWYESRVTAAGLLHGEPLWGTPPEAVAREVAERGFRARVVAVHLGLGDPAWLGREIDDAMVDDFVLAGIDAAGERGEYHTLVHDGPGFSAPLAFRVDGVDEREGHRFERLDSTDPPGHIRVIERPGPSP